MSGAGGDNVVGAGTARRLRLRGAPPLRPVWWLRWWAWALHGRLARTALSTPVYSSPIRGEPVPEWAPTSAKWECGHLDRQKHKTFNAHTGTRQNNSQTKCVKVVVTVLVCGGGWCAVLHAAKLLQVPQKVIQTESHRTAPHRTAPPHAQRTHLALTSHAQRTQRTHSAPPPPRQ